MMNRMLANSRVTEYSSSLSSTPTRRSNPTSSLVGCRANRYQSASGSTRSLSANNSSFAFQSHYTKLRVKILTQPIHTKRHRIPNNLSVQNANNRKTLFVLIVNDIFILYFTLLDGGICNASVTTEKYSPVVVRLGSEITASLI